MAVVETPKSEGFPALRYGLLALSVALLGLGLVGMSHAAIGYALFMLATLMLASGLLLLAIFSLTRFFDPDALKRGYATAFWMGGWTYIFAVAALAGYYVFEAFAGRIELRYIIFGPAILAALIVLDVGIYRVIVKRNIPTIRRFGDLWTRDALDQPAMRQTIANEVILHRTLLSVHPLRWLRHQLIFWGFGLMFLVELVAVVFREAFPAFGWTKLWYDHSHPIRLAFDIAYDATGLMILVGCILALVYRAMVNGTENQKYTDTPTTVFLLIVTITGFIAEGARLNHLGAAEADWLWASFVGRWFMPISPGSALGEEMVWILHALAACAFLAYIPVKRMIHSCATPLGRIVNSQKGLMAAKKARVMKGLARQYARWKDFE